MTQSTAAAEPVLPEVQMHLVKPTAPVVGRVVESEICLKGKSNAFIRHVAIDVSGTPLAGNFLVGQSFGVVAPGVDAKGKPHKVRLYSISSPSWGEDGEGNVLSTTPKRVLDERAPQKEGDDPEDHSLFVGVCSNYLCDLRPGDEVMVSGPNGKRFLLPANPDDHDYLFLATGTGIAPFRGMAMELLQRPGGPSPSQIHLVMGSPYTSDLLYDDLFSGYATQHENFHYHTAISREPFEGRGRGIYVDQYLERNIDLFKPLLANPRTIIYVCGLVGMPWGLYPLLARHGLAEGYITIKDELAGRDPGTWESSEMRRHIKPTERCKLEVY